MKNIIIFGGAFNPPTISHQRILRACVDYAQKINASIWILPSGQRADKTINVADTTRLKYAEALKHSVTAHDIEILVKTDEMDAHELTETIHTHQLLQQKNSDVHFIWVFGADSLVTMKHWHEGLWLWQNLTMLIIPRDNIALPYTPPHATWLDIAMPVGLSSTLVRQRIAAGKSVVRYVPKAVLQLIEN